MLNLSAVKCCTESRKLKLLKSPMNLKDREVGGTNKMGEEFKTVYKELPVQNVGKAFRYGDYDIKQDDKMVHN